MAVKIGESGRMEIEGIIKRAEAAIYPYGDIRIATEFTLEGSEQEYVIERDLLRLDKGEKVRITYVSEFFQDDNYGNKAASGTYLYRVTSGTNVKSMKMILLK